VRPRPVLAGLAVDPRLPIWTRRATAAAVIGVLVTIFAGWRLGFTAAAVIWIADTIFQSKRMAVIPAAARVSSAQRRSRRRLFLLRQFGYLSLHARPIPGTASVIDHLVVGPGGVYAVDSERWDRRLPVRTVSGGTSGPVLYHGPSSQRERLAHSRWEAAEAASLLSAELQRPVTVYPVMVIYGPTVPWVVTTLRGVDVLAGRRIGRYFRRQSRYARRPDRAGARHRLNWQQVDEIHAAAERALPPARLIEPVTPAPPAGQPRPEGPARLVTL
jgi:hypothetical protein